MHDEGVEGSVYFVMFVVFSVVATYGVVGVVGFVIVVVFGGLGVVVWVWFFIFLLMLFRMGEAVLACTVPVGRVGDMMGLFVGCFMNDVVGGFCVIGWVIFVLVLFVVFVFYGGSYGEVVIDVVDQFLSGSVFIFGFVVVGVGGVFVVLLLK